MLAVKYDLSCNHSHREDVTYGSWDESWDFRVTGVEDLGANGEYPKPQSQHDTYNVLAEAGEPAYVLSMVYDEGDSFGCAHDKGEVLMVFSNKKLAYDALAKFQAAFDQHGDTKGYSVDIIIENEVGSSEPFACPHPAGGYFETMKEIRLDHFIIT